MPKRFHKELEKIKQKILSVGAMVEDRVHKAAKAITSCDSDLALQIRKADIEIDEAEVEVEEECLKVLALYQPVAGDLRFLIAVIKINNDLERIADQAVNIAQRIITMTKQNNSCNFYFDYSQMVENVITMLKKSLDSLINYNIDIAIEVCQMDDKVDLIKNEAYQSIKETMKNNPEQMEYLINLFLISRHLERMADHSTNIAEEVIYMIEGEIVRHGKKVLENG